MRDPRFRSTTNTIWSGLIAQGRDAEKEIWLSLLVDQLRHALDHCNLQGDGDKLTFPASLFSDQWALLRSKEIAVPANILNALETSFESAPTDEITAQAAWCWGLALGKRTAAVAGEKELRRLLNQASRNFVMQEAFLEHAAQILREQNQPLLNAMSESIEHLVTFPGDFVLGRWKAGFAESLMAWKNKPPFEAFDLAILDRVPFHYEFLGLIDQLRKLDKLEYISWLDRLKNPLLVQHAFRSSDIAEDFDELLMLLDAAPPAYRSAEGGTWTSLIAPMLLNVALQHATTLLTPYFRLPRDEVAFARLCDDLSERMERLALVLSRRSDGPRLAADWLMRLVRVKTPLDGWPALPVSMALKAIVQVLGDVEAHSASVIKWLPNPLLLQTEELNQLGGSGMGRIPTSLTPGMDILLARLFMKAYRTDTESFEEELRLFGDLLLLRDIGLHDTNLSEFPTWRHQLVSCAFMRPGLVGTWRQLWKQMEEQRLRSRYWTFTNDHSADDASLFLASAAISFLGRDEGDQDPGFWNEVYEAIWFMVLLYGSQVGGRNWRRLFVHLAGTLPKHLDLSTDGGGDKLSTIVARFATDYELTIHTVAQLTRAGIPSEPLANAVRRANVDFESALLRFEKYAGNRVMCPLSTEWIDSGTICRQILGPSVA
jgi:hypothetical protein